MGSREQYQVQGANLDDFRVSLNFTLQKLSDRLDSIEGIRGVYRREFELKELTRNDNRPDVSDGDLFKTFNTQPTTILDLVGGFNGHKIWILVNDANTTLDFASGNIRERTGTLSSWTASRTHLVSAFYADSLWYCEFWDFEITDPVTGETSGGTSSKWEFVDITGNYTLTADDVGKIIRSSTASAHTVTVPVSIMAEGDQVVFYQKGAGQMTLAAGSGFTINTPSTLTVNEQYGTVTLIAESSSEGVIAGRMTP